MKKLVIIAAVGLGLALVGSTAAGLRGYGSRSNPYPIHHSVSLPGSGGWHLKVNGVLRNANAAVHAANEFNDPPARGHQFFMIRVTYVNRSKKSDEVFSLGELAAVGRTNVAYDYSDDCGVLPHELDDMKTVFPGGHLTGNICFSVRKKDVASLELYYTPMFSEGDTFFALR